MATAKITIREVAARAGVSPSTVSRVINGSAHVRRATRERVLAAVGDLAFAPDEHARALRVNRPTILAWPEKQEGEGGAMR